MNIREQAEIRENEYLSKYAAKSADTKGRAVPHEKCEIRTEYQRDWDRIMHSKSFRRLMHKTQVFISPEGDHYRTRLTHTLEVSQIARTTARALRLNEDLTEAIALGHDLGHTPFGHTGEDALNRIMPGGFRHNEQSVRVVKFLENGGKGLNLTQEVIEGILSHRTECETTTLEAKIVQLSDKIGYINHDIDDAVRAGILNEDELPKESIEALGKGSGNRIDFLVKNVVSNSFGKNKVEFEPYAYDALLKLRAHMFATVYQSQLQQRERTKIAGMMEKIFTHYEEDLLRLPIDYLRMIENGEDSKRVICDYIAGMTDRYALKLFMNIYVPNSWNLETRG